MVIRKILLFPKLNIKKTILLTQKIFYCVNRVYGFLQKNFLFRIFLLGSTVDKYRSLFSIKLVLGAGHAAIRPVQN